MKTYIVFFTALVSFILLQTTKAQVSSEQRDHLIKNCKTKSGSGEDEIKHILSFHNPESEEGRCFVACLFKDLNLVKDNNLSVEEMLKFIDPLLTKPGQMNKAKTALNDCLTTKDSNVGDTCNRFSNYLICLRQHPLMQDMRHILTL